MTTLKDLERIIPNYIKKMDDIASAMSRYKKYNTDGRARVLINEIKGKIKQIEKVYQLFKTSPSFKTQNFDEYVKMIEKQTAEFQKLYDIIIQYEDVPEYH